MKTIYAIAEAKVFTRKNMTVGVGYPFVNEIYMFSDPLDAIQHFEIMCADLGLEILHMSTTGKFPFAHAIGNYQGEKISITLHTLVDDPGDGDLFDYAT